MINKIGSCIKIPILVIKLVTTKYLGGADNPIQEILFKL